MFVCVCVSVSNAERCAAAVFLLLFLVIFRARCESFDDSFLLLFFFILLFSVYISISSTPFVHFNCSNSYLHFILTCKRIHSTQCQCVSCAIVTLSDWLANTDGNRLRLDDRMWEPHTNCSIMSMCCFISLRLYLYVNLFERLSAYLYTLGLTVHLFHIFFFHFPSLFVWMYFMLFGFRFVSFSFHECYYFSISVIIRGFAAIELSFLRVRFECSICISGSVTFVSNNLLIHTLTTYDDDELRERFVSCSS